MTRFKIPLLLSFFCVAIILLAAPGFAAQRTADAVLQRSLRAYQQLHSYQDKIVKTSDEPAGKSTSRGAIQFEAPRLLNYSIKDKLGTRREVYDGRQDHYLSVAKGQAQAQSSPLPDKSYGRRVLLQYMPAGHLFTPFLAGVGPLGNLFGIPIHQVSLGKAASVNSVKTDVLIAHPADDPQTTIRYYIAQKDHLVRRIEFRSKTVMGDPYVITETHSSIKINQKIPRSAFEFKAPKNAGKFPGFADLSVSTGQKPPAIKAKDLDGKMVLLDQYKGKVLLLDFWATWCDPCRFAMPHLKQLVKKHHSQGFRIVGISEDMELASPKKYINSQRLSWRQIFDGDTQKVANAYNVQGFPTTILIGRNGKVLAIRKNRLLLDEAVKKALGAN